MSETVNVTFVADDDVRTAVTVATGSHLLDASREAELEVIATCGGRGRCRSCRTKVLRGAVPPPTIMDEVQLGPDEVHEGFRLSCQTRAIADCEIMLAPPTSEGGHKLLGSEGDITGRTGIDLDSGVVKHLVTAKIPTEEHEQTSDIEEILTAIGGDGPGTMAMDLLRDLPEVLRKEKGTVTVTTFNGTIIDIEPGDTTAHKYGLAFDIGTTSIVGSLVDLNTGEQLAAMGDVNPQAVYGGDLMSRLAFAQFSPQSLRKLRSRVVKAVSDQIKEGCDEAGIDPAHVYKVVVVGNTAMHHIFLGIDPTYVGLAPYSPTMRNAIELPSAELLLKVIPRARVCFLPIVAGFVGADTMGAVLATRIDESDEIRVVVDIGTNGEVVMGRRGKLMACSAPAGPALEGAQIRHGMRGAVGAIEKVEIGDDVTCDVIGNAPPIGICGSGLIDAVAKMLDAGVLHPSGRFHLKDRETLPPKLAMRLIAGGTGKGEFVLARADESGKDEDITLTQVDIRQLQLAKGAIYAGVLMLQRIMEVPDDDIAEVQMAGGFGNYINIESAVRIHLLPALPLEKITYVGNAAALGAQMALVSERERNRANDIAREIEHVSLAARPDFQDIFMEALCFPGDENVELLASAQTG